MNSRWFFLEPFARSEPKKSNPASQGNDDVQKMRTLRAPDLSKVHLGAGGEKLKILASKFVLEIDFPTTEIFKLFAQPQCPPEILNPPIHEPRKSNLVSQGEDDAKPQAL